MYVTAAASSRRKTSVEADMANKVNKQYTGQSFAKQMKSNVTENTEVSRRTRRFKNGAKALKEIRSLQRTTDHLIPKASFCRVVREILINFSHVQQQFRIQSSALEALQEAAEMYLVQFFEDSMLCCLHSKRVTLMPQDCHLVRRLRGPDEVANK